MRYVTFTSEAWEDYIYWISQDNKTLKRLNNLIQETAQTPFQGAGRPEDLVGNLSGCWSRRIDPTNRLVYEASETEIFIISCRYHN